MLGISCWQLLLLLTLLLGVAALGSSRDDQQQQNLLLEAPDLPEDLENIEEEDVSLEARSAEKRNATAKLLQLSEFLRSELERRSRKSAAEADLSDVYSAGRKVGKSIDRDDKRRRRKKDKPKENIFVQLWNKLRSVLPLRTLIAVLTGIGLLLLLLLSLCCYCCCCTDSGSSMKRTPLPQTVKYGDISINGEKPPFGIINYSLEYDLTKNTLIVTVSNCQHLPVGLENLDPYVVVSLTDEKQPSKPAKSKTSKKVTNSSNPVFNFGCNFVVRKRSELRNKVVTFEVFDWDLGTRHKMVARKVIHFRKLGDQIDSILGRSVDFTKKLNEGLEMELKGPGDVCFSLYYAAKDKSLTVNIVECKAVFVGKTRDKPDLDTMPNTFIELTFKIEGQRKEQVKRTAMVRGSRNPYFNEEFVFRVGGAELLEASWLRITIIHKTETLKIKRQLGLIELGARAKRDSLQWLHWSELIANPNHAIARWHSFMTFDELEEQRQAQIKAEEKRLRELAEEEEIQRSLGNVETK